MEIFCCFRVVVANCCLCAFGGRARIGLSVTHDTIFSGFRIWRRHLQEQQSYNNKASTSTAAIMTLTIYLARHGQDEDNAAGILNGRRDQPLTSLGKRQARILAQKIASQKIHFDAIYASPLQRAAMTAEIVADGKPVERLGDLQERDFGILTGTPIVEIEARCGLDVLPTPKVTYFLYPKGAETFPQLIERAKRLLTFLQETHSGNESILLVTHGDFGKMLYAAYYDLEWRDVLEAFHFGNSDLILCSPTITSPPNPKDTHVLLSSETHASVTCNPTPIIELKQFLELKGSIETSDNSGPSSSPKTHYFAQLLVDCRCHLGECVIYDDRQNAILFTSILERKFHKLSLNTNGGVPVKLESFDLPKMLCAFGLLEDPIGPDENQPGYIVAWDDGFQLYDLEGGEPLSEMSQGEVVNRSGLPDRLNDGRVDPTGTRFVCGGCAGTRDAPLKVYKCEYDEQEGSLKHSPIVDEIRTTNSICWSNDGKIMYLADSPTKRIDQYDYNVETGELSNKRPLHTKEHGDPDGSVVDSRGFVWNATWRQGKGTGTVERINSKTGKVNFTVHLPDETSEASCCCFGGPNLDILFVTTAFEHLDPSKEPHAGGLYACKLPSSMTGCPEKRFKLGILSQRRKNRVSPSFD
jgi:sugar lactone lactonase YvrE/broad specificity phosphatase PhoE